MDFGLSGKVAMVAAASKGIGLASARMLAREGCAVSICGRTAENLAKALESVLAEGGQATAVVADVSSPADLERWYAETVEKLGPPEILVTNTGGPPAGPLEAMTDEQWAAGFESTLMNVVRLVRLVLPGMREKGFGRIVHITSLVAKEPNQVLPISVTLRAGLMGLTRLQATEFGPDGITVNSVLPGHTLTDRQRHLAGIRAEKEGVSLEEALERQGRLSALGRLADPDEIAAAVAFLCSRQASYITGVNLLVDGGAVKSVG
ncbi:MAG: SDR family oxidoreductase [Fimbriimonadaceae bacterium]